MNNNFSNKIESILLLDQLKGQNTSVSIGDFNNFLKHLDEKILFNQLDETIRFNTNDINDSQIRTSLIEQEVKDDFTETKHKKLMFFIKKLEVEENVKMRLLAFADDLFEGINREYRSFEDLISSLNLKLKESVLNFQKEKLKVSESLATITEKELRLVEVESELQKWSQRALKAETEKNNLRIDLEKMMKENDENLLEKNKDFLRLKIENESNQKRIGELILENTDLNQLNEHRRKTIDQIEGNKTVVTAMEVLALQVKNEALVKRNQDAETWMVEKKKELADFRNSHQMEIDVMNALCAKYTMKIEELEKGNLGDMNQSLDIKGSLMMQGISGKGSLDGTMERNREDISILEGDERVVMKGNIEQQNELKRVNLQMEKMRLENQETILQNERVFKKEIDQIIFEKQSLMQKINELMTKNFESEEKAKNFEIEIENLKIKVQNASENYLNIENSNKFLKSENQKLHEELSLNVVLPIRETDLIPIPKKEHTFSEPVNYFKLLKGLEVGGEYNFKRANYVKKNEEVEALIKVDDKVPIKMVESNFVNEVGENKMLLSQSWIEVGKINESNLQSKIGDDELMIFENDPIKKQSKKDSEVGIKNETNFKQELPEKKDKNDLEINQSNFYENLTDNQKLMFELQLKTKKTESKAKKSSLINNDFVKNPDLVFKESVDIQKKQKIDEEINKQNLRIFDQKSQSQRLIQQTYPQKMQIQSLRDIDNNYPQVAPQNKYVSEVNIGHKEIINSLYGTKNVHDFRKDKLNQDQKYQNQMCENLINTNTFEKYSPDIRLPDVPLPQNVSPDIPLHDIRLPVINVYDVPLQSAIDPQLPLGSSFLGNRRNSDQLNDIKKAKTFRGPKMEFSAAVVSRIKQMKIKNPEKLGLGSNYSYNHLNMEIMMTDNKYVLRETRNRRNNPCFSDIVNRMNKWENKTEKYILILNDALFIFNDDRKLKARYPIRIKNIRKIQISADSNFFCIVDYLNQYEVLESIRKEELINYIIKTATIIGHPIEVQKVTRMYFENSEQKQIIFNPVDVKKYKPHWMPTFNYAQKRTCLTYAKRDFENLNFFESIFDQRDKCLLLLTNLAILVFTTIEFNVKEVIPLVSAKVFERDLEIVLTMSDQSKKLFRFFSELDKNIWANSIRETIKNLEK